MAIPPSQIQAFTGETRLAQFNDPAIAAAAEAARARIQAAYLMAYHQPRNQDDARARILAACKRPAFAERVEYAKPVGGRQVRGPSIRFAELALREWGNVVTESQVIYEDETTRRIRVTVTDLETNTTYSKEIQIPKTVERKNPEGREVISERINTSGQKVFIVKATDEELHNKEAALISKAVRNEGLRLIPSDIIDEAIETARQTLLKRDQEDPQAAKKRLLDAFAEIGVMPKDIEQYLGHKTNQIQPAELQELRGIYRAIRDGEARWQDYVEQKDEVKEKTTAKAEELKSRLKKAKKAESSPPEEQPKQEQLEQSVICPEGGPMAGDKVFASYCNEHCRQREGCPAWE